MRCVCCLALLDYCLVFFFFLMIRRPPRSTQGVSSAASDVYKRQKLFLPGMDFHMLEFRILVFFFFMTVYGDEYLTIGFTYLIEVLFLWFRGILCSRNLSLKTMVDQRFFI
eukprot:TRINITY_DN40292_c0_g1_i1.p1 TRINITY_DN40292_c0_g1~~TRINITY_DN40292_c0_g1_i1.p1  ORF type:complete len:111 (-),score=25.20 TRINITY_DN40292_c0_g1_i1:141-473(-)